MTKKFGDQKSDFWNTPRSRTSGTRFWKKKSLGQNFLINPRILDKIVNTAEVTKDDIILEVGPGTGLLTRKLAQKSKKVIAIEKDRRLIPVLNKDLEKFPNIILIEGDILKWFPQIPEVGLLENYKIVANIPYYITSHFLRMVFEKWPVPELIVLTIQREVAQRIMAKPPHMNLLALSVQYYSEPKIVGYISRHNFRPVPKVDSVIIYLKPKFPEVPEVRLLECLQKSDFWKIVRLGFSEKRKQLASLLSKKLKISKNEIGEAFRKINIPATARAENLSLEQWISLKNILTT